MEDCRKEESEAVSMKCSEEQVDRLELVCVGTGLFCRCWAQVLVSLQQTLAERALVRWRFHSGKRHLTLVTQQPLSTEPNLTNVSESLQANPIKLLYSPHKNRTGCVEQKVDT